MVKIYLGAQAIENVISEESDNKFGAPLLPKDLIRCAVYMEGVNVVEISTLLQEVRNFNLDDKAVNSLVPNLLEWFHIMSLSCGNKTVILNIHEFTVESGTFAHLLCIVDDATEINMKPEATVSGLSDMKTKPKFEIESERNKPGPMKREGGRPAKHKQFPLIATNTINNLKISGFAASSKCRNTTARGCGVTLNDNKKHLKDTVPDLKEADISKNPYIT